MILLDTHVLIWFIDGDQRLGRSAREAVEQATRTGEAALSAISLWEIGFLVEKTRIELGSPIDQWIADIQRRGVCLWPITVETVLAALQNPAGLSGDAGDRLLVGTARERQVPLMTADRQLLANAASGHLQAIDARR